MSPPSGKPIWLLDVDGVLNATSVKIRKDVWPLDDWIITEYLDINGKKFPITTAGPVIEFINSVSRDGLADVRWHSTWQELAPGLGQHLGLDEFPVADPDNWGLGMPGRYAAQEIAAGRPKWWKYAAAWRVLTDEQVPLVWTDDDVMWETTMPQRRDLAKAGKALLIYPDSHVGLSPRHLKQIEDFLTDHREKVRGALTAG